MLAQVQEKFRNGVPASFSVFSENSGPIFVTFYELTLESMPQDNLLSVLIIMNDNTGSTETSQNI